MPLDGGSDWQKVRLGDVSRSFAGGTPSRAKPEYFGPGLPWLKSGEVRAGRIEQTEETITPLALKESSARLAKAGTPVIAMYGATAGVAGILGIDAALNQAVLAVEPREEVLDAEFCFQLLQAHASRLLDLTQGSGQPNLSKTLIEGLEISLPPLDEQRRIAEVLRAADTAAEAQRACHSQLNAVISRVREWLIWADAGSALCKLGDCVSVMRNGAVYDARTDTGDALITRIETIAEGEINYERTGRCKLDAKLSAYLVEDGDILFSHINSVKHIGKTAIKRDSRELYHGMNLMLLRANGPRVLPDYLYAVLLTERARAYFREHARVAVNQASVNKKDIGAFEMPCPPTEIQIEITGRLAALEASAGSSAKAIKRIQDVRMAMRSDLLSGRVRVPR